ncbi:TF-B3 domain-containing protein [Abeliophyllum distichum]|uniref:TF-B3 domain-containing protein n=1 Tax=Abeliophyllum distichum TaxID=126358 RepID=A0ABD1R1C2_9LAMI
MFNPSLHRNFSFPPFSTILTLKIAIFHKGIPQHQTMFNINPFQIVDTNGKRLVRLGSSATKEAMKKRMAYQRLYYPHHHRHHSHHNQHQNQTNVDQDEERRKIKIVEER